MARITDPVELFEAARSGDRGALARLLSYVERGGEQGRQVGRLAYPHSGAAYTVGLQRGRDLLDETRSGFGRELLFCDDEVRRYIVGLCPG